MMRNSDETHEKYRENANSSDYLTLCLPVPPNKYHHFILFSKNLN